MTYNIENEFNINKLEELVHFSFKEYEEIENEELILKLYGTLPVNIDKEFVPRYVFDIVFKSELLFDEVTRFNLVPSPDNYDSIIYEATLLVKDGNIFWSPEGNWSPNNSDKDEATWISAKKLSWREVPWLGEELKYGPK